MRLLKRLLILLFVFSAQRLHAEVPEQMTFCGMKLTLKEDARVYIQTVINKLHDNEARFQLLVERSDTWMPFVEEALDRTGLPMDLKYIVLQESALQGDAVSTSNAVGFWQFKEPTAIEVGLTVDNYVDERKHIFRSSMAAASYFHRLNRDFDNWIYAITGYNQGPTGALPYVKAEHIGKEEMVIDLSVHWYALKAIAHKLAFESVVGKNAKPRIWLEPVSSLGITSVDKLAAAHGVEVEALREYNLWISGETLPHNRYFTVYIPHVNEPEPGHVADPLLTAKTNENSHKEEDKKADPPPMVVKKEEVPAVAISDARLDSRFEVRKIQEDPDYGTEYVVLRPGVSLVEEAVKADVRAFKLMEWNEIEPEEVVKPGTLIRLVPRKKALYHVVKKGQTLALVAEEYGSTEEKLANLNRCPEFGFNLYEGQKLYLKKKKPAGEKIILLELTDKKKLPSTPTAVVKREEPKVKEPEVKAEPLPDQKLPVYEYQEVVHTVEKGDTLWSISKRYNTTVELIQKMNNLRNNALMPGMKLKVMERREVKG